MKRVMFLLSLFAVSIFSVKADEGCSFQGQKCSKALSCGLAQACPFDETVQGTCNADLKCIAEGDACTLPNREELYTTVQNKGVYKKDGNGELYCARTVR